MDERFALVGVRSVPPENALAKRPWYKGKPLLAAAFLALVALGCLFCPLIMAHDPTYMDLSNYAHRPDRTFLFGTDTMGRDIFSMIWYGGRVSLTVGLLAAALSALIAVVVGAASGLAPRWLDGCIMRLTEIFLSVPSLLLVMLLQAALGKATVWSLALVLGLTSWAGVAKVVRTEVLALRRSEYVLAARAAGGGFFHILRRHLAPNFFPSIMFMVVMNVRGAIVAESTLSFLGVGLPLEVVSWGSMLSLSQTALTSGAWWIILIPGLFLVATLLAITEIGNWLRGSSNKKHSNL